MFGRTVVVQKAQNSGCRPLPFVLRRGGGRVVVVVSLDVVVPPARARLLQVPGGGVCRGEVVGLLVCEQKWLLEKKRQRTGYVFVGMKRGCGEARREKSGVGGARRLDGAGVGPARSQKNILEKPSRASLEAWWCSGP